MGPAAGAMHGAAAAIFREEGLLSTTTNEFWSSAGRLGLANPWHNFGCVWDPGMPHFPCPRLGVWAPSARWRRRGANSTTSVPGTVPPSERALGG